ncbi:MAG: CPBP family intramembrane glutamic endopeptidase [Thermoplasmatota archaeon]
MILGISTVYAIELAACVAIGVLLLATGYGPRRAAGGALMAWPFALLAAEVGASWIALFQYNVLSTIPASVLLRSAAYELWDSLLVPLAGLVLWTGAPMRAARFARLLPPRDSFARDSLNGLALVPIVTFAYFGAVALLVSGFVSSLENGDETRAFLAMTPVLIIVVSVAAALSEEFLYRGLLLSLFARFFSPYTTRRTALIIAAFAQALAFGFAHAGYGTWAHILGPLVFGLAMAWVTLQLGIVPAMILHASIDIVSFSLDIATINQEAWLLMAALLGAAVGALLIVRGQPFRRMLAALAPTPA